MDYFKLLGLKQGYNIDSNQLKKQYLTMQARFHPDKAKSTEEKREALNKSMLINEAYKILQDDYLRAKYLLELKGQEFNNNTIKNILSHGELEEILDQFEAIDDENDIDKLKKMEMKNINEQKKFISKLVSHFDNNELKEALDITVHLKYLTNLVKNIRLKIKKCK